MKAGQAYINELSKATSKASFQGSIYKSHLKKFLPSKDLFRLNSKGLEKSCKYFHDLRFNIKYVFHVCYYNMENDFRICYFKIYFFWYRKEKKSSNI